MDQDISLDLRLARRQSGLTQADCAHLLGVDRSIIAKLESGKVMPSVIELAALCLIFDRPPDAFGEKLQIALLHTLVGRLASLPNGPKHWRNRKRRVQTLAGLAQRLEILNDHDDG